MTVNKMRIAVGSVAVVLIVLAIWLLPSMGTKTGYFKIEKVYGDFLMKKDLEAKIGVVEESQNFFLDSLKFQIRAVESRLISNPGNKEAEGILSNLYQQYKMTEEEFSRGKQNMAGQYNKQVITHLKERGEEFRKKKGLDVFFGVAEETDLLFFSEGLDQTDEFIEFINSKYSGDPTGNNK